MCTLKERGSHMRKQVGNELLVCIEPEGQKEPGINILTLPTVTHQLEENKSYDD